MLPSAGPGTCFMVCGPLGIVKVAVDNLVTFGFRVPSDDWGTRFSSFRRSSFSYFLYTNVHSDLAELHVFQKKK